MDGVMEQIRLAEELSLFDRGRISEVYPRAGRSWQAKAFGEFQERMESKVRAFPCVFGVNGFTQNQLRYAFFDGFDAGGIANALNDYVRRARSFGANTSLVVFCRSPEIENINVYHLKFWNLLRALSKMDREEWPAHIPENLDDPMWEFCFAGEPMFVICTTPAHIMRQSRRSSHVMLFFQPRWVFANILDTPQKANAAFGSVRERVVNYDEATVSPSLGMYGASANREHLQYFLGDDDKPLGCPFQRLR